MQRKQHFQTLTGLREHRRIWKLKIVGYNRTKIFIALLIQHYILGKSEGGWSGKQKATHSFFLTFFSIYGHHSLQDI